MSKADQYIELAIDALKRSDEIHYDDSTTVEEFTQQVQVVLSMAVASSVIAIALLLKERDDDPS